MLNSKLSPWLRDQQILRVIVFGCASSKLYAVVKVRLKDRIGHSLYRGGLAQPYSYVAFGALKLRLAKGLNLWRATASVIETLKPDPEVLQTIWNHLPEHFGKPLFLLHIMKTGGTSVRINAGKAIHLHDINGRMLLEKFGSYEEIPPSILHDYQFWPFMAGHLHIDMFPTTHTGITLFREPRSRLLSHYRQLQRTGKFAIQKLAENRFTGENVSLKEYIDNHTSRDCVWQFTHGHSRDFTSFLSSSSTKEILTSCEKGLQRIEVSGWTHQMNDFNSRFEEFLGVTIPSTPHNTFPETSVDNLFYLSHQDLELIHDVTKLEADLQHLAVNMGLIPALSRDEADELFEKTARRLNFVLP